jgi:DNA-binding CsgD family transcriptional regulator
MAIMYWLEDYTMAKAHTDRSLQLSSEERLQLESLAASRSLPAALVRRAKIILFTEEGMSDREAARRLSVAQPTVSMWRRRFRTGRLNGLHDELKPGRPRSHDEEQLAQLLNTALCQRRSNSPQNGRSKIPQFVGAGIGRCLDQAVSLERLRRLTVDSSGGLALGRERMCSGSS